MANSIFLLLGLISSCYGIPTTTPRTCGYKGCPVTKEGMINVHLVPHTHDDVGWLKTPDQYYYGSKSGIQRAGVQYILDSVVQALLQDPNRRFIYVESEFFFRWWDEQTPELQDQVRVLVNEGRLEFAGGAWSMNDEATVHYQSVIDQFSIGLKKLKDTFGECGRPKIGWQIDPFGHSREMASIFAQMGYDGQFFARLDWVDKSKRMSNKTAEMIWHGSPNLGSSSDLFTGALYNHYSAPPGFCFDTLCQDEPIIDSKDTRTRNVDSKVKDFIDYINNLNTKYRTNHLMVPMGDDFNYQEANINFKNMDKLIKYVNEMQTKSGSKINVFYSTPACYLKSLNDAKITWPEKTEDFFPYSSDPHAYWTGYYSSRPTVKRFEREGNHFLQVCKQLSTLADLISIDSEYSQNLDKLKDIMGVMQHHDAVTGTEKQHVSDDYEKVLNDGMIACEKNVKAALQTLTKYENADFQSCFSLNISTCWISENMSKFVVTLFNPLSKVARQIVRVPVHGGTYEVKDSYGNIIDSQLVQIPSSVEHLPFRSSKSHDELVFITDIAKLDSFIVQRKSNEANEHVKPTRPRDKFAVKNSKVYLEFDDSGRLSLVRTNGVEVPLKQDILYYNGAAGNNAVFANRSSGAYIFRPNGTLHHLGGNIEITVIEGPIVKEVHQKFNDWISQVIRIYEDRTYVEFEWLVGSIPIEDKIGKEVVSKFSSNIKSGGTFYTDSNGRDMLKRKRYSREDFEAIFNETESANYYPVTASIALEDSKIRMAIFNDRAQGGSSLSDGSLELMVHRRLLHDDAFGVGEALNETEYGSGVSAKGKHYLLVGPNTQQSKINERRLQLEILLPHWKFFSTEPVSVFKSDVNKIFSAFSSLPADVNILTLEPLNNNQILLRLENILEKPEGSTVIVNIQKLCKQLKFSEIRETTLDGNMWLSDMKRLRFTEDNGIIDTTLQRSSHTPFFATSASHLKDFDIVLTPMSIRTFVLRVEP